MRRPTRVGTPIAFGPMEASGKPGPLNVDGAPMARKPPQTVSRHPLWPATRSAAVTRPCPGMCPHIGGTHLLGSRVPRVPVTPGHARTRSFRRTSVVVVRAAAGTVYDPAFRERPPCRGSDVLGAGRMEQFAKSPGSHARVLSSQFLDCSREEYQPIVLLLPSELFSSARQLL